jgi:cation diffusion facilitator CzcD-associated flavoprotein CzcO
VAENARFCIIGAGPSGLAVARHLKAASIPFAGYDMNAGPGGLWRHGEPRGRVYASAHLISSTKGTQYPDYPFPQGTSDYPNHREVMGYLEDYAEHFGLRNCFRWNTEIVSVAQDGDRWAIRLSSGEVEYFAGVVIANGHLWDPAMPDLPGSFDGEVVHSSAVKDSRMFADKRVLIVGSGNTGCDLAVDAAHHARSVAWSVRSGNWFVPKYIMGKPADGASKKGLKNLLPLKWRARIDQALLSIVAGPPDVFGLPKPKHHLYERIPIVNTLILYHLGQGDVIRHPKIVSSEGKTVHFADGSKTEADLIVMATGYRVSIPFIDPRLLNWRDGAPDLLLNIASPNVPGLFVAGLLEATSGGFHVRDAQAQFITALIRSGLTPKNYPKDLMRHAERERTMRRPSQTGQSDIFVNSFTYSKALHDAPAKLAADT